MVQLLLCVSDMLQTSQHRAQLSKGPLQHTVHCTTIYLLVGLTCQSSLALLLCPGGPSKPKSKTFLGTTHLLLCHQALNYKHLPLCPPPIGEMPGLLRLLLAWAGLCCLKVGGRGRKFLGFFSGILGTQSLRRAELIRASFLGNWKGFSAAVLLQLGMIPL